MASFCIALPFRTARGATPVFRSLFSTHRRWFSTLRYPTWRRPGEALFCLNKVEMLVHKSLVEVEISVTDTLHGMVQSGAAIILEGLGPFFPSSLPERDKYRLLKISSNDLAMQFVPGHISIEVKPFSLRNSGPSPKIYMCLLNDMFATTELCKVMHMHSYVVRDVTSANFLKYIVYNTP